MVYRFDPYAPENLNSKKVKLPTHRAGLPGKVITLLLSAFIPAYKAGHSADFPVKNVYELWRVHTIDLRAYEDQLNLNGEPNALEVIIQATAVPWGLFYYQNEQGGYGQLAVDWIELLGAGKKSCDP